MYNLIFGHDPDSHRLLEALGLRPESFYRYRDCYLAEDGTIAVYTRAGGGNRESGEATRQVLMGHPAYLYDRDDVFDSTYATFYFKAPAGLTGIEPKPAREAMWQALYAALEQESKNDEKKE